MEKPDPICPACRGPAKVLREINAALDFWQCEGGHMFVVDKKPPPRVSAAATAAAAAAAALGPRDAESDGPAGSPAKAP